MSTIEVGGIPRAAADALARGDVARANLRARAAGINNDLRRYLNTGEYARVTPEIADTVRRRTTSAPSVVRVLLVEDDVAYARNVAEMIREDLDVAVDVVGGVVAAVDRLRSGHYAAVIADIDLSDGYGMEVAERAREADDDMPILMMSCVAGAELASISARAGAQAYFDKGGDPKALVESVRRLLVDA